MKSILISLSLIAVFGCKQESDSPADATNATLELSFISGHLGSYSGCVDESTSLSSDAAGARAAGEAADCDGDNCGGFLNCDVAMVRLRLNNVGTDDFAALNVTRVQLLKDDATFELEVMDVRLADGGAWDGGLAAGAMVDLHIEYRGPSPSDAPHGESLSVEVTVTEGDNGDEITTPELQSVPQVAT